jgi:hypothetical protein
MPVVRSDEAELAGKLAAFSRSGLVCDTKLASANNLMHVKYESFLAELHILNKKKLSFL